MTQDEIIEMAREADLVTWLNTSKKFNSGRWWIEAHEPDDCLFKFAELVAQREREACANAISKIQMTPTLTHGVLVKLPDVVNAIRTRGDSK